MKYRTIVADPPWEMKRGSQYVWRKGRASGDRQELDYPTLTTDDISAIPVSDWAHRDAHAFIWTTHRHLEATFGILRSWGFGYVCTLTWCKQPHGWGPGGVFQSTTEFVLYGRRGLSGFGYAQIERQWWTWPRGEHSQKPDAFLDIIEATFPAPRLEMFARRQRLGWDTWGNEALEHVSLETA